MKTNLPASPDNPHGTAATLLFSAFWTRLALVDACARWAGFDVVFPGASGMKALMLNKMVVRSRLPVSVLAEEAATAEGHPAL